MTAPGIAERESAMRQWATAIDEFPYTRPPGDQLAALVPLAVRAPSSHNTQPWLFLRAGDQLELYADRNRRLPVVDPSDRELTISCGAALGTLEVALRGVGFAGQVSLLPDPGQPDLLARIGVGPRHQSTTLDHAMAAAIRRRRTARVPFLERALDSPLMAELEAMAERFGTSFRILQMDAQRTALGRLVSEGNRVQMGNPEFRKELAEWLHHNRTRSRDGMPGWAHGFNSPASVALPLVVRTFDTGGGKAAHDYELALGSPLLAVLTTPRDTPRDWLAAGRSLARLLLRAEADGVAASYLNQPIEVPELRVRIAGLLGGTDFPQMILRMGYPMAEARRTPRREIADVLREKP